MSITSTLEENKENVNGIQFNASGYTIYLKDDPKQPSTGRWQISGHEGLSDEVANYLKENNIPVAISPENMSVGQAMALPLVGTNMEDGPISPMNHVSFNVFANLVERIGGKTFNVPKMNFIDEMFSPSAKHQADALKAFVTNDPKGVGGAILDQHKEELPAFDVPEGDELDLFARTSSHIDNDIAAWAKMANDKLVSYRKMEPDDKNRMRIFCESKACESSVKNLQQVKNVITWNSLMVKAGNLSIPDAWKEIQSYCDDQEMRVQATWDENKEPDGYSHLKMTVDSMSGFYPWMRQMSKAAIYHAEKGLAPNDDEPELSM